MPKGRKPKRTPAAQLLPLPDFDALLAGDAKWAANRKLATRRAYGIALRELGRVNPRVVAVDADVSNSTFADIFRKEFPDRFFECKIAEQNMITVAGGLAAAGKIPFASSFAKFLSRAYDQIEMAGITRANIKIVGSHAGVTLAADGPSQMGLLDVAFFRSFTSAVTHKGGMPVGVVFRPADGVAAFKCTEVMANWSGMCYMRTHRPDVPLLYAPDTEFTVGGCHILREGGDLAIAASGYMVHEALAAAEELAQNGVSAAVIDAYCLPVDEQTFLTVAGQFGNKVLCVEDNYAGGLGSELAEIAAKHGTARVRAMTVSRIPKSGKTPDELLAYCGVGKRDIVAQATEFATG